MRKSINDLLDSSLESVSTLIDSSKILGKPIQLSEDKIIVPIAKVTLGFGVGGSEFNTPTNKNLKNNELLFETSSETYPYGGGSLGGVSIIPEAFIVINHDTSSIIYIKKDPDIFYKTLDLVSDVLLNKSKKEKKK